MISHGKDIKVFSGNANPKLAEEICKLMGTKLGEAEVGTFSDGEIFVSLYETVRGSDVFVGQSSCTPGNNNLMELLIMIDALKRASAGRITAVIPYYGYARQDRKAKARDPISAKLVANLLTVAGADRVLTMDLHAAQIQGFFDIPVDHHYGAPLFAPHCLRRFGCGILLCVGGWSLRSRCLPDLFPARCRGLAASGGMQFRPILLFRFHSLA